MRAEGQPVQTPVDPLTWIAYLGDNLTALRSFLAYLDMKSDEAKTVAVTPHRCSTERAWIMQQALYECFQGLRSTVMNRIEELEHGNLAANGR